MSNKDKSEIKVEFEYGHESLKDILIKIIKEKIAKSSEGSELNE